MATVKEQIDERVAELSADHTLSRARTDACELTLADLAARGEWPPVDGDGDGGAELAKAHAKIDSLNSQLAKASTDAEPVKAAGGAALAARVVEALRAHRVQVSGAAHKAIAQAIG